MNKKAKQRCAATSYVKDKLHAEVVFNQGKQQAEFAINTKGELQFQQQFTLAETVYHPPPALLALVNTGTIQLADDVSPYHSIPALIAEVRNFIHQYVDVSESFEIIATYYVLLTWLYDKFNELPYLRVTGDYGSGKTRFLKVVGALCYKSIFASGASTTAPLFHLLNTIQGTLVIDESDFRYSDTTAELTKILNNGNAKGFSVLRCEQNKDGKFTATSYSIYGPKLVAARESFIDDALESRFITERLGGRKLRTDIPVTLPERFDYDALQLRNKLLKYRFEHRRTPTDFRNTHISRLSGRTQQIYLPLLSLITEEEHRRLVFTRICENESQLRVDRGLATEAELLTIIHMMQTHNLPLQIAEITKQFTQQYQKHYTRRITPKWIGYLIRSKLSLATRKTNGVYIIAEGQLERLERLLHTYDVL